MTDHEKTQPLPAQEASENIKIENANIEQNLDEEQLRAITGGCGICQASLEEAGRRQTLAHADIDKVALNPTRSDANLLLNRAARNLSIADLHHRAIIASGHVDVSQLLQRPRSR